GGSNPRRGVVPGMAARAARRRLFPADAPRGRMSVARIDLMASAAGKIGGVTWHHLLLVATDASGGQACLRAGPQCLPLERLAGRKSALGDAGETYAPSPARPSGGVGRSGRPS